MSIRRITELLRVVAGLVAIVALGLAQVSEGEGTTVPGYVLGPDDQIMVQGLNADELAGKPMRIDANGDVDFPLVGTVHAGGLTVAEFRDKLNEHMKEYLRNPQLVVSVTEYRSQPVSVLGAVNTPGIHQLQGKRTLVEMISTAGGFRPDAGSHLSITRQQQWGKLPLERANVDADAKTSTALINFRDIATGLKPEENILIMPHDIISVPRAATIYVVGDVKKPGGFLLGESDSLSVMQALSLAEGVEHTADSKHARIIRSTPGSGEKVEIACNVQRIVSGKQEDQDLKPQDILFIPSSTGKRVAIRALEAAIQTGSGVAIFTSGRP